MRILLCLLGIHRKKYVGVVDFKLSYSIHDCHDCVHKKPQAYYCSDCRHSHQVARWACERCTKMGEKWIRKSEGLFTIEYGYLVPDEKRWGNLSTKEESC